MQKNLLSQSPTNVKLIAAAGISRILLLALFIISLNVLPAFAAAEADVYLDSTSISFSNDYLLEGKTVRTYITVHNGGTQDQLGSVKLLEGNKQIGTDQVVSVVAGNTDTVFVDWIPLIAGSKTITAKVIPWDAQLDDPSNNSTSRTVYVDSDTDRDGIADQYDEDDDNDGTPDSEDAFPLDPNEALDTDGDGIGDNADEDDDNDGTPDSEDAFPLDPNETLDTDGDGIGDNADEDDDNDGIPDELETGGTNNTGENQNNNQSGNENSNSLENTQSTGTDPKNPDSDADGTLDGRDAFPLDPSEQNDTDGDGIGDNSDPDADGDGIPKEEDEDDTNKGPIVILSQEPGFGSPNENLDLDASPSYDEDGEVTQYNWTISPADNPKEQKNYTGKQIGPNFDESGTYLVTLTLTDDKGEKRQKEFKLRIIKKSTYIIISLILIIALALYITFKYTAGAKKRKSEDKAKKTAEKSTKSKKSSKKSKS